jgi:hypothetical protein
MRRSQFAYVVTLADNSQHLVRTDRDHDCYTGAYFRQFLEDTMRRQGKVDESRISIRNFWYHHAEMNPEAPIVSRAGRAA